MITKNYTITEQDEFIKYINLVTDCDPQKLLFFDIETTGLSAVSSYLYLIGCLYPDGNELKLTQFLCEDQYEEAEALKSFSRLSENFTGFVHFNGQTFDIPYLQKKCTAFELPDPFEGKKSFDLFRTLRKYKNLFGTENARQKSFEKVAGYYRDDEYDGGQLIEIFSRFCAANLLQKRFPSSDGPDLKQEEYKNLLLLHNHDDVLGMVKILKLFRTDAFFSGTYPFSLTCTKEAPVCDDALSLVFNAHFTSGNPFESLCSTQENFECFDNTSLTGDASSLTLKISLHKEELKLYYPNYKDYYYLPAENKIVPVSIGRFMDKNILEKATRANCFTRHTAAFIPYFGTVRECPLHIFRKDCSEKQVYIELNEFLNSTEDFRRDCFIKLLEFCLIKH